MIFFPRNVVLQLCGDFITIFLLLIPSVRLNTYLNEKLTHKAGGASTYKSWFKFANTFFTRLTLVIRFL